MNALDDHGNLCDDCKEADVQQSNGSNERPDADKLPSVDEKSPDSKAGFKAGQDLEPIDSSKSAIGNGVGRTLKNERRRFCDGLSSVAIFSAIAVMGKWGISFAVLPPLSVH